MTINVTAQNNNRRVRFNVDSSTTIGEVLDIAADNEVIFGNAGIMMGRTTLMESDMNKTLEDFGYTGEPGRETVSLLGVERKNNA